jgi:predicted transcriptional regulator
MPSRKAPKPADDKNWKPHDSESWIFISNAIDTYGLDPYEFRVLAHVARRAGQGTCNASQETIANSCGINKRRVMASLQTLCTLKILKKVKSTGRSNHYKLQPSSQWERPTKLQEIKAKAKQS